MPRPASAAAREAWSIMETLVHDNARHNDALVHDLGLAPRTAKPLRHVEPDAPLAMSRLAEALHCDNSNVTQIVDRLEADGLVERRPAPHERRGKARGLNQEGRPVGGEGGGRRTRAEAGRGMPDPPPLLAALRGEDARLLRDALRRMIEP